MTKLSFKQKLALGLVVGFFVFYFFSSVFYSVLFADRSVVEELMFVGAFKETVLKVFVLVVIGAFSIFFFRVSVKNHQAESMLSETEQRWATTLASIGDAVIIADSLGKISFMNAEAEKLTGWLLADAKNKPTKQIFKIKNLSTGVPDYDPVSQVLENGQVVVAGINYELSRKDKTVVIIGCSAVPIKDDFSDLKEIVLVFHDLTKQVQSEQDLTASKDYCQNIVDAISDPLYVIDSTDYRILSANDAASKLLKLSKQELVGKTCHEMTHHRLSPCETPHFCPMKEVLATGKSVRVEHVHLDKDQKKEIIELTLYPIKNQQEMVTSVIHVDRNITETKKEKPTR